MTAATGSKAKTRLSALAPLRDDILAGDYRTLYLAWLLAAAANDIDEELEPPVPPGLKELSAPLAEFVRFFQLDPFLVQAAAQASEPLRPAPAPRWMRSSPACRGPSATRSCADWPRASHCWH